MKTRISSLKNLHSKSDGIDKTCSFWMIEIIHFLAFVENIYQVKNYTGIDRISIVTISKSIYLEKIDR